MAKIFKAGDRRFEENAGRINGFRLASDAAITARMAEASERTEAEGVGNLTARATGGLGAGSLNFDVRRLNAGELSSLYHFHRHAEELFMIISGVATLRTPDGLHLLEAGDIAFFETGASGAHQMYNHTAEPCIYLDVRTFAGCDIAEYPDSGKLLIVPAMEQFRKSDRTGYFEGESAEATIKHFKKD